MNQDTKDTNLNPSVIARETLKQLAILKISPTPDNYHKLYDQIAGNPENQISAITAKLLTELAKEFPRHTPTQESRFTHVNARKYPHHISDSVELELSKLSPIG